MAVVALMQGVAQRGGGVGGVGGGGGGDDDDVGRAPATAGVADTAGLLAAVAAAVAAAEARLSARLERVHDAVLRLELAHRAPPMQSSLAVAAESRD